ncbi:MAG: ssDNA-binding protein, mitochondrial [Alyxoria varia]|nr:MAG: ssDNA-binding protein, mitochondrial [Alyxoria varia]
MSFLRPALRTSVPSAIHPRTTTTTTQARRTFARMSMIGRLAAPPEVVTTPNGREVVRYALGSTYGPSENRQVSWFRVASFDDGAKRQVLLGLPKGTQMYVEAEARMRVFDDQDGKKNARLDLVQRYFEALSRPRPKPEEQGHEEGAAAQEDSNTEAGGA